MSTQTKINDVELNKPVETVEYSSNENTVKYNNKRPIVYETSFNNAQIANQRQFWSQKYESTPYGFQNPVNIRRSKKISDSIDTPPTTVSEVTKESEDPSTTANTVSTVETFKENMQPARGFRTDYNYDYTSDGTYIKNQPNIEGFKSLSKTSNTIVIIILIIVLLVLGGCLLYKHFFSNRNLFSLTGGDDNYDGDWDPEDVEEYDPDD